MKIAVISNIQSNIYALKAFLEDSASKKVDVILNLGDSFFGDIAPRECYDLLRESSFINICGNEDRMILEASLDQLQSNELLNFVYNDLREDVLYWIQDLPFEKLIGEDFYMIHGTYFDDSACLFEKDNKPNSDEEILRLTDDIKSKFIFCSNTKTPKYINLQSGQIVIAPGYLGNREGKSSYIILDIEEDKFGVELQEITYQKA